MDPVQLLSDRKGHRPLRELAAEIGVSVPFLSYVLNRQRAPGKKVLDYLGLQKVEKTVTYRRINGSNGTKRGKRA